MKCYSCCMLTKDGTTQIATPLVKIPVEETEGGIGSSGSRLAPKRSDLESEYALAGRNNTKIISVQKLNNTLERQLNWVKKPTSKVHTPQDGSDHINNGTSPVSIHLSYDAGLLNCETPKMIRHLHGKYEEKEEEDGSWMTKHTIFGIEENQSLFSGRKSRRKYSDPNYRRVSGEETPRYEYEYEWRDASDLSVIVEAYSTKIGFEMNEKDMDACLDLHPHFDWTRRRCPSVQQDETETEFRPHADARVDADARVKFIDLTKIQQQRRKNCTPSDYRSYLSMDNPGSVCHLLRSVLKSGSISVGCIDDNGRCTEKDDGDIVHTVSSMSSERYGVHCASPWREFCVPISKNYETSTTMTLNNPIPECDHTDQIIALLVCNKLNDDKSDSIRPLGNRYYWDDLEQRELREITSFRTGDACPNFYLHSSVEVQSDFSLEDLLSTENKKDRAYTSRSTKAKNDEGFTLLVYRHLPKRQFSPSRTYPDPDITLSNLKRYDGCLWERIRYSSSSSENGVGRTVMKQRSRREFIYRMVAPPYQCHRDLFGTLFDRLTSKESMAILVQEALRIPQWTAWPERNHYQSDYDNSDNIDGAYPASWTVFPLCHTFPANDVSNRKWISLTCSLVPKTTELLRSLGPFLRTALFSRLEPRTTLGAHTGWADLANHVLRVHIPLQVPSGKCNDGLCGTWVDGCVETHVNGRIICFDDSKTHRAFNYTEEERIVLIVDVARPEENFPLGTATGSHTNELDSFIKQFT